MNQGDVRMQSDSGFHAATSTMAKHHDAAVDKMQAPSHASFESKKDALKEISGVSEVDQDIQANKETFKARENDLQHDAKTALKKQEGSLKTAKKEMQQGFKENDEEWIGTKAGRALWPGNDLNNTSKKD